MQNLTVLFEGGAESELVGFQFGGGEDHGAAMSTTVDLLGR